MARKGNGKTLGVFARVRALISADGSLTRSAAPAITAVALSAAIVSLVVGRAPMAESAARARTAPISLVVHWPGGQPAADSASVPVSMCTTSERATWLDPETRARIQHTALEHLSSDPFDTRSLLDTQHALMNTGWFGSPVLVRREPGGFVRIAGAWRVPAAVVRDGGVDRVVTRSGELLDKTYLPGDSLFPVVLGAAYPPPVPGKTWLGGDVQAGLALLDFLRGIPGYEQIAGVDVSEYVRKKRLVLVTDLGNRIIWGGAPADFSPGQARPEIKRRHLQDLYNDPRFSRRLDAGQPLVDVSLESGVSIICTAATTDDDPHGKGEIAAGDQPVNHADE